MNYKKYEKLREERGLTDYKVCKETGISTATMSSWKQGFYNPKVDKMAKIAKFFDVPLEYFLGD